MGQPDLAAPVGATRPQDDPLVGVLHAVVAAADAESVQQAAVAALAERTAVAWIVADHDGQLEVVAASGMRRGVIGQVAGNVAAGDGPWSDACAAAGLTLSVWQPLGAASVPDAFLGAARSAESAAAVPGAAAAEMAQLIGAMLDAHAYRLGAQRPLDSTGRLDWLEATRRASRSVRHDLANVLTGVSFYISQLVVDLGPGTASAEDAAAIGDVVAQGSGLLELLHQLSRDPAEATVVPLDPAAVVDGMAPVLTPVAAPCTLRCDPLESMVVRASRRSLEESVMALVVEARGAAAGGFGAASLPGIRVGVTSEVLADGNALGLGAGRYAALTVDDDDSEPDETVAAAPGSLADTAPASPGFGPALAAAFAHGAGGALRIVRTRGGGTRMTILLPEAVSRSRRPTPWDGAPDPRQLGPTADARAPDEGHADG